MVRIAGGEDSLPSAAASPPELSLTDVTPLPSHDAAAPAGEPSSDASGSALAADAVTSLAAARLPTRTIVDYSLPSFGMGFMFILVNIYLIKFSTDVLLVAPATMGLLFGFSRLWDAVADPVVGFLTDRTRSRHGRRRPWILASALPLAVTFAMLWAPPGALAGDALLVWLGVALVLFYTAIAMLQVAHDALGAELTDAYHDRTRVFGVRRIIFGLGSLLAVGGIAAFDFLPNRRATGAWLGLLGGIVAFATTAWMVVRIRERPEFRDRGSDHPLRAFADVWRNPHARILLVVFLIQQLGLTSLTTIMPFLSEYVLETPSWTFVYILVIFVASIVAVPIWLRFSPHISKKTGLIAAMAVIGTAISSLWFAAEHDIWLVILVSALGGFAAAGTDVLFPSIQADAIDWDELHTGERKEGAYFAAWAFAAKGAGALASMLVGFALTGIGFVPNAEQTPAAQQGLRLLAALGPAVLYALGIALFLQFRLGEREHAEIQRVLARRRAA
jgi:GPH family glycoside/pentoside/hexuronide:cation symporter